MAIFVVGAYFVVSEFYIFYEVFPSFSALRLAAEAISVVGNFIHPAQIIIFSTFALAFSLLIIKLKMVRAGSMQSVIISILVMILSIFVNLIVSRNYADSHDFDVNDSRRYLAYNPILYFFRSAMHDDIEHKLLIHAGFLRDGVTTEIPKEIVSLQFPSFIVDYEGYELEVNSINKIWNVPVEIVEIEEGETFKNVILVVLESIRANEIGMSSNGYSLTPNIDDFIKESMYFNNHYSTSRTTVRSEQSILCSIVDTNPMTPFSVEFGEMQANCLPRILRAHGFDTLWFHGNTSKFFNRNQYHKSLGFNTIFSKESFVENGYDEDNDLGWGVPDKDLFKYALNVLNSSQKPFFPRYLLYQIISHLIGILMLTSRFFKVKKIVVCITITLLV
ncbi:LTA synthase family protein [Shewanella sp. NIFS-20-20]|nr:LTA synthase family protein [Shewanella sp. NIFS-20-20]